jgi:hypothetical protein
LTRYEAREDLGENDDPDLQFVVTDNRLIRRELDGGITTLTGTDYIGPCFSEAEARIIAFALNAVAEGRTLIAGSPGSLSGFAPIDQLPTHSRWPPINSGRSKNSRRRNTRNERHH